MLVCRAPAQAPSLPGFPLEDYSYSSWTKFGSNPVMFRINKLNGDRIETTSRASNVLGRAVHGALQRYFEGQRAGEPEGEMTKAAHAAGVEFLKDFSDGFIEWTANIATRAKLDERFAFAYFGYVGEFAGRGKIAKVLLVEQMLKHRVEVEGRELPVPLKGSADLVYEDLEGQVVIWDHKMVSSYSADDKIDGAKLVQAAFNYFLVGAELGRMPHRMVFSEFKTSKNKDGSPQARNFEIVFADTPMLFELFFRLYEDITAAMLGRQVYVPNLSAVYDNEVAILAYIHRLDEPDHREKAFARMKVDNITDFLKRKIQKAGAMKKYLETVSKHFVSATTLNYATMTTQEKVKMKLAEHGIGVEYREKIVGGAFELYCYEPAVGVKMSKIEAYAKDIEQVVGISGIRVLAPIPDSELVGFEIPRKDRSFPGSAPASDGFNLAIGVDIHGQTVYSDIRKAPHALVAGATGSGKSVFVSGIIRQLAAMPTDLVELVLLDPKMVELCEFRGRGAYHDDLEGITSALEGLVAEMNRRYKVLQAVQAKNLEELRVTDGALPYVFVFIDEYGDLMASAKYAPDIRLAVLTLAQKARAAGIHLVLTTQRPSVKTIPGDIKANFPTRFAFKTASATDSAVIIDEGGAEKLLGKGDMLFLEAGASKLKRLQGFS